MMFFLKNKSKQFGAFKAYKAWAERHTDRQLKCIQTDRGSEFLSNEQKGFMEESRIEHQTSMPDSTTKWESRTVPANHTEQGGVNAPHGRTQFRVLELCRQDHDSRL